MEQTLKSIHLSGLVISETAERNSVILEIEDKTTILNREQFEKLHEAGNAFLAKTIVVKCGSCGHEITGSMDISDSTATLTVEPCQTCFGKEPKTP